MSKASRNFSLTSADPDSTLISHATISVGDADNFRLWHRPILRRFATVPSSRAGQSLLNYSDSTSWASSLLTSGQTSKGKLFTFDWQE